MVRIMLAIGEGLSDVCVPFTMVRVLAETVDMKRLREGHVVQPIKSRHLLEPAPRFVQE